MTNERVSIAIFNDERELLGVVFNATDKSFPQIMFAIFADEYNTSDIEILDWPVVEDIGYGSSKQGIIIAKINGYEYTFYAERTYIY